MDAAAGTTRHANEILAPSPSRLWPGSARARSWRTVTTRESRAEGAASPLDLFRSEAALWVGAVTTALLWTFGDRWLADLSNPAWYALLFAWTFAVMLWLSFGVVRHADGLAHLLGEPYGTLILTLSVISIEVVLISAVMLTGDKPTLGRDTMFSVLMIVLNGILGTTLLLGGLRHHEQIYNLQGASAYLGVILPLSVLGLVLPRFTTSAPGGQLSTRDSIYLMLMSAGLYAVFLAVQTMRHSRFFAPPPESAEEALENEHDGVPRSAGHHAVFLVLTMLPIVLLSKKLATLVDHGVDVVGAPQELGGFFVATLVLSPEALSAARAALANRLQRTVNIALGSALSTIGLTIPAVLAVGLLTGETVELGLEPLQILLLLLTLLVSIVNLASGRTNVLHGAVHLILFFTYVVLLFD
jgi:Ca2+:H+ antiporter